MTQLGTNIGQNIGFNIGVPTAAGQFAPPNYLGMGNQNRNQQAGFSQGYQGPFGAQGPGMTQSEGQFPQLFNQFINQSEQGYNQAKQANLDRYNQGMGLATNMYNQGMTNVQNFGQTATANVNRQFGDLTRSSDQNLVNSGLSNSTIQPSVNAGIARNQQAALTNVGEQTAMMRNQAMGQFGGQQLGFLQARNDPYPDLNGMMGLAMNYAQNQQFARQGGGGAQAMAGGMGGGGRMMGGDAGGAGVGFQQPFQPMGQNPGDAQPWQQGLPGQGEGEMQGMDPGNFVEGDAGGMF